MLRNTLNTFITATLIMLLGVSSSASAQTIVPAGNLMGTTSVTFEGQKKPAGYSSALKIALVPTAPTIQEVSRVPSDDHLPGKPVTVTYRITSEANGPDDYALATDYDGGAAAAADAGLADPPTTSIIPNKDAEGKPTCGEGPCNLGATAATGPPPPDGTTITVPSDGVEGDAVNGISAGAIVVINQDYGNPYTVLSVADDGNTADIGLSSVPEGIVLGTRIAEQKTFQVVVSDVALLDPAASGAVSLAVTGTSADGTQTGQAPLAFTVTGTPIEPSYERYVRNLNNDRNPEAPGLDTKDPNFFQFDSSDGLNWYFKEAVSAKEGDKAEILIVMNAGNLADQTNITLNETLSPFVDYVSDSSKVDGKKLEDELDGTSPILNADGWTVTDGGEEEPENLIIAAHGSAHLTYQVKVIGGDKPDEGKSEDSGGGDGDEPEIAATYTGCLIQDAEERQKYCFYNPDGTLWNGGGGVVGKMTTGSGAWLIDVTTACWRGGKEGVGEWVVGANGYEPDDLAKQGITRAMATGRLTYGQVLDPGILCNDPMTVVNCDLIDFGVNDQGSGYTITRHICSQEEGFKCKNAFCTNE